jgi:activator of HSP90 ATPase
MKTFKKTYVISAAPSDVFAALTNPFTISLWTGYPAVMSTEPGSEFSLWDGDITGRNLEFLTDRKIVQEWYFGEHPVKSIVVISIKPERERSVVDVEHSNIPDEVYDEICEGWDEHYMGAINAFLNPNF